MTDAAQKIADMIEAAEPQESTAPRSLGFSVHAINEDHALVLMGSKAVIVKGLSIAGFLLRLRAQNIRPPH
jgi:hypothetical protein